VTMEEASTADQFIDANPDENWQYLNPSPDRERLYLAQGLAEGVMVNPQAVADPHAKASGTRRIPYDDIVSAYYNFHKAHAGEFRRSRSVARVAVLLSVADAVFDWRPLKDRFYGACETLLKAHIPYDVRVLEFPDEIDLDQYRALLVPGGECLSDAALELLARAAQAKKTLLTVGPLGARDEHFLPRQKTAPPALKPLAPLTMNLGEQLFPFNDDRQATGSAELARRVLDAVGEQVRVAHPNAARLTTTLRQTGGGAILHVMNFNIPTFPALPEREQLAQERVVPAENVSIVVNMPAGARASAVRDLSPDHAPATLLFEQRGAALSFTIPRVQIWDAVFIDTQ